jgi:hypothetical protein
MISTAAVWFKRKVGNRRWANAKVGTQAEYSPLRPAEMWAHRERCRLQQQRRQAIHAILQNTRGYLRTEKKLKPRPTNSESQTPQLTSTITRFGNTPTTSPHPLLFCGVHGFMCLCSILQTYGDKGRSVTSASHGAQLSVKLQLRCEASNRLLQPSNHPHYGKASRNDGRSL